MGKKRDWDKVREVVEKTKAMSLSLREGAEHFGIKVNDIYEFNRKLKKGDFTKKNSNKASAEISILPKEVQHAILDYRKNHPNHGFKRIEASLKQNQLVGVTRKQIRKVLKANGLLETLDSSFDRKPRENKGDRRFEADFTGELYQMDVR